LTLFSPYTVEAITCSCLLMAMILPTWIPVGKPFFPAMDDRSMLRFVSWACLLIGFCVKLLQLFVSRAANDE